MNSIHESLYQCAMKMGMLSKKRQQQHASGRAVLVTFYVVRPRRSKDGGGGASAASSRKTQHHHHSHDVHHHHHHHLHHHLHGRSHDEARRGSDRRADLLEYSRQLRATSATRATTPPPHPKPPLPPPRHDIKVIKPVSAVRHDDRPTPAPAAGDDRRLVRQRRLERAASLQEVRYRCLGYGGGWNWKKVFKLVLPCQSGSTTDHRQSSKRSKKRRDTVDSDSKKNSRHAKAWPAAAQLVSKLKVSGMGRRRSSSKDDGGLVKKLFSMFRQQPRPSR